jgi:phage terminase large subunit
LRADVAAHRRWGKDDIALNWTARACHQRIGTYWHLLPEASQARKAIWDAINPHTGKRRIDEAFPEALRAQTLNNEMFIRFKCGSSWQVIGSDNYNSLVGSPPIGITFSEWQLARPEAWTYMRPILAENGGWALFLWTSRGRNHAVRAFEARERDKANWFTQKSTALETSVFTVEQLDRERQELIDEAGSEEEGDAKFRQEYLVDFDAAVPGSYFGAQIKLATDEGRIGAYSHIPSLKVDTAWDIGRRRLHRRSGSCRTTASGSGRSTFSRRRARARRPSSGPNLPELNPRSRREGRSPRRTGPDHALRVPPPLPAARRDGARVGRRSPDPLPDPDRLGVKPIRVGVQQNPVERINAARRLLPVVCFDAKRCAVGPRPPAQLPQAVEQGAGRVRRPAARRAQPRRRRLWRVRGQQPDHAEAQGRERAAEGSVGRGRRGGHQTEWKAA